MKKIRSNFVKESLLDYANLAQTLKENSSSIVKDLLKETVLDTYNHILSEEDEKEYDESVLEEAVVYSDTYKQPSRKKCALLSYVAIKEYLLSCLLYTSDAADDGTLV